MVAIGHALVDLVVPVADAAVGSLGLEKGTMSLVDGERAGAILAALSPGTAISGGSAANTAVGIAALGGAAGFVGKVRDDEWGRLFVRDIRGAGVAYDVPPALDGPPTGRSIVLVTPDGEKTMCTDLGVGDLLGDQDVDPALVSGASVVYLEGYLCGLAHTEGAVRAALEVAGAAGTLVALSLSDPLWVRLHRNELAALLPRVGLLFANGEEACRMVGTEHPDVAAEALGRSCATVVVTLGAAGSLVVHEGRTAAVAAVAVDEVVDTTGAGDLFAAGFLHAHLRGAVPEDAARLGAVVAAEAIGHLGARPVADLGVLAGRAGLAT